MRPQSIGIIGGAGPLAGAFLLKRVFCLSRQLYGCCKDADFPKVFLISFPFSEMLSPVMDAKKIQQELKECLLQLRNNGACILAIACNTLHAFLEEEEDAKDLIHLPRTLAEEVVLVDEPLIFCTSTSARFGLHKRFLSCIYPDLDTQQQIDKMIELILQGVDRSIILEKLKKLFEAEIANTVILGCTELSLFAADLALPNKFIIDPLEILANKIVEKSFLT